MYNRNMLEKDYIKTIIYELNEPESDSLWNSRLKALLITVMSLDVIPNSLELVDLISHNNIHKSKLLETYLECLPGMRKEHINGFETPPDVCFQNHGFLTMMLKSGETLHKNLNLLEEKKKRYIYTNNLNLEISLEYKTNDLIFNDFKIVIGDIKFKENKSIKNILYYLNNYKDLEGITNSELEILLDMVNI